MNAGTPPDYYVVLGIAPDASHGEIRKAYRRKSLETHPDCIPGLERDSTAWHEANARMRLVVEAWEILGNPERRAHYDSSRANPADSQIREVVRQETRQAEQHSAEFPKEWDSFQAWQDDVWPELSQTKNVTPRLLFILIGGTASAFILYHFISHLVGQTFLGGLREQFPNLWFWFWYWTSLSFTLVLFANLANALSSQFPSLARPKSQQTASSGASPNRIYHVACSGCGVTLRFPRLGKMRVTCPRCGTQQILS